MLRCRCPPHLTTTMKVRCSACVGGLAPQPPPATSHLLSATPGRFMDLSFRGWLKGHVRVLALGQAAVLCSAGGFHSAMEHVGRRLGPTVTLVRLKESGGEGIRGGKSHASLSLVDEALTYFQKGSVPLPEIIRSPCRVYQKGQISPNFLQISFTETDA